MSFENSEQPVAVKPLEALSPDQYMKVHDAAILAYESNTPSHYRYSAVGLRRAVDAAFQAFAALAHPPAKREAGETLVGKSHELLRRASLTLAEEADHIITGYCASASPPAYLRDAMLRLAEAAAKVKAALEASHE